MKNTAMNKFYNGLKGGRRDADTVYMPMGGSLVAIPWDSRK